MSDLARLRELADGHRRAGRLPEAECALRRALAIADVEAGACRTTAQALRAELTRLLIESGRDAEAAEAGRHRVYLAPVEGESEVDP